MRFAFRRLELATETSTHREFVTCRFCRFGRFALLALVAGVSFLLLTTAAQAATVRLAWDPVSSVKIYKLYYGMASRSYTSSVSVTNLTAASVSNLLAGTTYYFAVTAVATNWLESDYSSEVVYTPSGPTAGPNLGTLQIQVNRTTKVATLSGVGTPSQTLYILVAANPSGPWGVLTNVVVAANGTFSCTDQTTASLNSRFYRLSDSSSTTGLPGKAALRLSLTSSKQPVLTGTAAPGKSYDVQIGSTPSGTWSTLGSVTGAPDGTLKFIDATRAASGSRFYRLLEK